MKDFINIITAYEKHNNSQCVAIGIIIAIEGNSFRRTGFRILIRDDGHWFFDGETGVFTGSILDKIQNTFECENTLVVDVDTASIEGRPLGIALGYRGVIQLFIHPLGQQNNGRPITILKNSLSQIDHRILMTITQSCQADIKAGDTFLYQNETQLIASFSDKILAQAIYEQAESCWEKGRSSLQNIKAEKGSIQVFYEILTHPPKLVLFGGQYDIYPLAQIAKSIGWRVVVVANPEKLRQSIFSIVDEVVAIENVAQVKVDSLTAFILMSHIFERDMDNLIAATKTSVPYIGMLGPEKRFTRMFTQLSERGFILSKQDEQRVFAPMGLDIGSATQEEIAIALIAEIRAFFSNRDGGFLKKKKGTIHDR